MKKFSAAIFFLLAYLCADAQVFVDLDMLQQNQNTRLEMVLQDSRTKEPLAYASVYIVPQGDTTITNFALSDAKGKVEIEDIIGGKYTVNAEMIGYKPYVKVHTLKGWHNDLGFIDLEEDPEYIDAATITALATPVTILKDTLVYNAAAFRVGENAMLEDLLKKMPGMEVGEDGTVKVNGEAVDKITVGGKTFFFNDPSMALKNLPAKVVDKIKVIDKDKDEAAFSGIATQSDKEKVMDVELKEEYKQGWFGNARISGGSTLGKDSSNELLDDIGGLFNANAMAAWYNETDQITLLGNGMNASNPGSGGTVMVIAGDMSDDDMAMKQGHVTSAQAGANYNTERVKGMELSSNVSYNYTHKDAREKSFRTSFQPDGSGIDTDGRYDGVGTDRKVSASVEMEKKDTDKFMFNFRPGVSFTSRDRSSANSSSTTGDSGNMNSSTSRTASHSDIMIANGYLSSGVKDLGKEGRTLSMWGYYSINNNTGNSVENSETRFPESSDIRDLVYDKEKTSSSFNGALTYAEPLSDKWTVQARFATTYDSMDNTKLAFNGSDGSANDYYSSWAHNRDLTLGERVYTQYEKEDDIKLIFGASLFQEKNVTESRTTGIENVTGEGEWLLNWAPYAEFEKQKGNTSIHLSYSGRSSAPQGASLIPALDISNPVFVSTGNIYLKPAFSQTLYFHVRGSNPRNGLFYHMGGNVGSNRNATVFATWFDTDGIRYSIPVNSRKAGIDSYLYCSFGVPLDKQKRLTLSVDPYLSANSNVNYQAKGTLPGFDKNCFDYDAMMAELWGDPSGDRFYAGKSGFAESRTTNIIWRAATNLKYRLERFSADASAHINNNRISYSLDENADIDNWSFMIGGSAIYETKKGFEFKTDAKYNFYRGYAYGFGDPTLIWNASVGKTVKSVVFSLSCANILNRNTSLRRTSSAEYYQDTYSNVMGRYFLAGITFNFGKMNAKNNQRVQGAMYNMMF